MKANSNCTSPAAYLASLPPDRQSAVRTIHDAITKKFPELKSHIQSGMLGYGRYHYKYASGREGEWPVVALASQKQHLSLYICATDGNAYLPEKNKARLGKVSVGKSCIRFKKLEDLDLAVALELIGQAANQHQARGELVGV